MLDTVSEDFLEGRGLSIELATRFGIHTANVKGTKPGASVLVFPYMENGAVVNEKFRMLPKEKFWQLSDKRKIFWNADALDDPALEAGLQPLVICEGELDALAAVQSGFPLSVSVPDGAPPPTHHGAPQEEHGPIGDESSGRYEFLWNARDKLKRVKRFVLATDGDAPGSKLREELTRRLSAGRCSFLEYPIGCKDINDVLRKGGAEAVALLINGAKQCPVRGLYRLSDYPDEGELKTFTSGWPLLDQHFKLFMGEFIVITGIPQHGKSSFALQLLAHLANLHGFRAAIFSPEMKIVPVVRDRFRSIKSGRANYSTPEINAWIEDNFVFIGADPLRQVEDDYFDLEWIIDKATEAVLRDGIRVLLLDPWNEVEHARQKGESMTDYVARGIRMLKRFARDYNVIVIVVAHPTKMARGKDGKLERPTLYDISDSAHWYNKPDHGLVIYRQFETEVSDIDIVKSRFDEAGETGMVKMKFDRFLHRFYPLNVPAIVDDVENFR
jgi:twinkle protein